MELVEAAVLHVSIFECVSQKIVKRKKKTDTIRQTARVNDICIVLYTSPRIM
jgi:hypothetical protein